MRSAVEISMYPLTRDYLAPIQAFIDRLNTHPGLIVRTNALATQIWGPLDQVMAMLTQEIARSGVVRGIQRDPHAGGGEDFLSVDDERRL